MYAQVVPGQATEIFKRHIMPQFERLSFSLVYTEEKDNEPRTLDLTCKNEPEFMLWFWGIQVTCRTGPKATKDTLLNHSTHVYMTQPAK